MSHKVSKIIPEIVSNLLLRLQHRNKLVVSLYIYSGVLYIRYYESDSSSKINSDVTISKNVAASNVTQSTIKQSYHDQSNNVVTNIAAPTGLNGTITICICFDNHRF